METDTSTPPSLKKKTTKPAMDTSGYEPLYGESFVERAAHFADWAAKNFPHQFASPPVFARAAEGAHKAFTMSSDEVKRLMRQKTYIDDRLTEKYGRCLIYSRGVGLRASVDKTDVLKHKAVARSKRIDSAVRKFQKTAPLIQGVGKELTGPENAEWRQYNESLMLRLKELSRPLFSTPLLPPPEKKDDENSDKKNGKTKK
jgi:hypothetical protein